MNFIRKLATGLMVILGLVLIAAVCFTTALDSEAQIARNQPVPQTWTDSTGTNAFTLNSSAVPVVMRNGTATTGVTTNMSVFGGSTNQLRLRIVNGIVTGVIAD